MDTSLQLNLNLADKEQTNRAWAFAKTPYGNRSRSLKKVKSSVITSCSKEARNLGIKEGMRYEEARLLIPEMKVLVIGGGRR